MGEKYTIMVINEVFENENLLIIKSKGSQTIVRYDEYISHHIFHEAVEKYGINISDCKIVATDTDWKGELTIEKY